MLKIFGYECRRLLCNKFFAGLALIVLFYGWQVLDRVTILGVSHTAPFSPWSFGDYLSRMLPLLWIGALFFLTFFTSNAERRRAVLTSATPVNPSVYGIVRCCAALIGIALLSLAAVCLAAFYYWRMFGWHDWGTLLAPALLTLAPPLVFALGSGWMLGRLRPWLVFVWMLLPVLLAALPLPEFLGLLNGSIFTERPLSLGTLDPAFSLPAGTIAAQCAVLVAGAALLIVRPAKAAMGRASRRGA